MKRITLVNLKSTRNGEHYDFIAVAVGLFNRSVAKSLGLEAYFEELNDLFIEEDLATRIVFSSQQTPAIQQFEHERTEFYLFINQIIRQCIRLSDPVIRQAASHLLPLSTSYKGLNKTSQRDRSGLLTSYVDRLQNGKNATAVEVLGLANVVEQLKTANQLFVEAYAARADENEKRRAIKKMSALRPHVDEAYEKAMLMINAVYAANEIKPTPDPAIRIIAGRLIDSLDANALQMQSILSARRHRAGNKREVSPSDSIPPK